ncbi:omega-amidase, chloroplastic-like [Telopea speciosissima]|uniref:omega-amidase, chloroplastic-like n=1 Tax=Telopea speciosissima TaxID=54955 RepID=UPI001CC6A740|nr:omega-amidase, chloroplastic-like [Telopea speciosissima]
MARSLASEYSSLPHSVPSTLLKIAKFKVGLCQLTVSYDKEKNIARARKAIEDAAKRGAQLVVLPEMWNCPYAFENFSKYAEDFDDVDASPSFSMLTEVAHDQGVTIVGGSIPERCGDQLYNTSCVFGTDGKLMDKHRKMHLFDVNIPGDISFKESNTFTPGEKPTIVDTDVGRIGIGICHDMRFPELGMLYAQRGAHLICYPGAFNMHTGELLWELAQRARAADNQVFVVTCSPARESSGCYMIWGHSTLSGPFGEIIATTGHEETTVIADIDYSIIQLRRENLPLYRQRRGDIYQLIDAHELKSRQ